MNSHLLTNKKPRFDRIAAAQSYGRHVPNGYPHHSSNSGLCICLDPCCQNEKGCKCKSCPCHALKKDHSELLSISDNTISLTILDGVTNGLR